MNRIVCSLLALALAASPALAQSKMPFNGKDFTGWKFKHPEKNKWKVGIAKMDEKNPTQLVVTPTDDPTKGEMVNLPGSTDIYTDDKFGDALIEVDLMVPKGSNSGVYVMGVYEVQVLDSYGREKLGMGDLGALYSAAAPKLNASKKPGEWQKFIIDFQAPKFDDSGKKTSNAKFLKVTLNDQVIHENIEMKGATPGGLSAKESTTGPIMFQGDHGAVSFKNLKITPR